MTDIHSEIKSLKTEIQKDIISPKSSNSSWKELITIVKSKQRPQNKEKLDQFFNPNVSLIPNPLGKSLDYRICNDCGKPVSLVALVDHLEKHCKGSANGVQKEHHLKQEDIEVDEEEEEEEEIAEEMSNMNTKKKVTNSKRGTPSDADPSLEGTPTIKKQRKSTTPAPKKQRKSKPRNPTEKHLVDFDKQCGVELPEGGCCGRSLTCKSHSMGAKRAVQGRSQPFDVLLAQYHKKNQLKVGSNSSKTRSKQQQLQQKEDMVNGIVPMSTLTPEEETTQVLNGVSRSFPLPLETTVLSSTRARTKYFRMREMFASSFSVRPGFSAPGYGAIHSRVGCVDLDRTTDYTFRIRTPQPVNQINSNNLTPQQIQKLQQQRMLQAQMLAQQAQQQQAAQQAQQQVLQQPPADKGLTPQEIQQQQQRLRQQQVQQQRFEAAAFHLATATKLMQAGPKSSNSGGGLAVNGGSNGAVGSPVNKVSSADPSRTNSVVNNQAGGRVNVGLGNPVNNLGGGRVN